MIDEQAIRDKLKTVTAARTALERQILSQDKGWRDLNAQVMTLQFVLGEAQEQADGG